MKVSAVITGMRSAEKQFCLHVCTEGIVITRGKNPTTTKNNYLRAALLDSISDSATGTHFVLRQVTQD